MYYGTGYRRYPIGIQNFELLRNNNCVYVEKTWLIYQLTHTDSVYFLSYPFPGRRAEGVQDWCELR